MVKDNTVNTCPMIRLYYYAVVNGTCLTKTFSTVDLYDWHKDMDTQAIALLKRFKLLPSKLTPRIHDGYEGGIVTEYLGRTLEVHLTEESYELYLKHLN